MINTQQFIILVGSINFVFGLIMSSTPTYDMSSSPYTQQFSQIYEIRNSVEDGMAQSSHVSGEDPYDKTAGNPFDLSINIWDILKWGFLIYPVADALTKSPETIFLSIILFLQTYFWIYVIILAWDKIKSKKVD